MSKENIKITEYSDKGYFEVKCADGHYITNWDKNDILKFTDAKIMYCPLDYDISGYYCLTEEEHNEYIAQLEEKIKELDKA